MEIKGDELDGILITHEHSDHIQGLGVFSRKVRDTNLCDSGNDCRNQRVFQSWKDAGRTFTSDYRQITHFSLVILDVHPFAISHDANEPSGYRIEQGGKSVAVATDLGKYDDYTVKNLKNLDAILLEANHDIHMLEVGGYPYYLKQRILGDQRSFVK